MYRFTNSLQSIVQLIGWFEEFIIATEQVVKILLNKQVSYLSLHEDGFNIPRISAFHIFFRWGRFPSAENTRFILNLQISCWFQF